MTMVVIAESSQERILEAAEQLFAAQGYSATSIAEIRDQSGLPNGSIYYHFGSKLGILSAILQRGVKRLVDDVGATADLTVDRFMVRAADVILAQLPFYKISLFLILEDITDVAQKDVLADVRHRIEDYISFFLNEKAREAGVPDGSALVPALVSQTIAVTRGGLVREDFIVDEFRELMRGHARLVDLALREAGGDPGRL